MTQDLRLYENKAPTTRTATLSKATIKTIPHAAPDELFPKLRSPIAARIQPQIKNKSNVPRTAARTGIVFASIKNDGLAWIKPLWLVAMSISSADFRNKISIFASIETTVGGKLE